MGIFKTKRIMKTILLIIVAVLVSCSTSVDQNDRKDLPKTYKLIKMSGSFSGSETTGENMPWQETILFKTDGTFEKVRIEKGHSTTVNGKYVAIIEGDESLFELTYTQKHQLIGNCTGNLKELYTVINDDIIRGTWWACDGPGLEYERTK